VTLLWFLLRVIPAIRELVRPTEVLPLKVGDRSAGEVDLADEARVLGSVAARRRVMTGAAAWIGAPVIAEDRMRLGQGSVVGGPYLPATVSAPEVELGQGAAVYGQVSAPRGGPTF